MIETVTSLALPADEVLRVQKNRILPMGKDCQKRICIVTGIHGDELEGQYVCYKVLERIERERDKLTGTVDIYPAMNPLGIDSVTRGIPGFDLDMNRIFPGNSDGTMAEYVASEIIKDLSGADLCIDIHASNIYLTEIPQVRINELHKDRLVPIAEKLNVDLIWVHGNATVLKSTLAYSLNSCGTDTLVVEMGVGMRITKEYCEQLTDGIFRVMKEMGLWQGSTGPVRRPMISESDGDVVFLNAGNSGVFVQSAAHGQFLEEGEEIGRIIDPLRGVIRERVLAPERGVLFTIREYPIVDEGSLVARILRREAPYEKVCDL